MSESLQRVINELESENHKLSEYLEIALKKVIDGIDREDAALSILFEYLFLVKKSVPCPCEDLNNLNFHVEKVMIHLGYCLRCRTCPCICEDNQ